MARDTAPGDAGDAGSTGSAGGIDHVVVLMLENRSFDHMLGLLDHPSPDFPRIAVGNDRFANPTDPNDTHAPQIDVSADADFVLPVEPPHSHESVMEQLGVRFGKPRMNGFVAAYRRRVLDPNRDRPILHWFRIALTGIVLVLAAAGGIARAAEASFVLTWVGLWVAVGIVSAGIARKREVLPPMAWGSLATAALVATFTAAGLAAAIADEAGYWWAFGALLVALVVPAVVAFVLGRFRTNSVPRAPAADPASDPGAPIMRCMDPMVHLPALATLATNFAVCTHWHCSVPGATWPNRNFVHAATSDGTVDIEVGFYEDDTIFDRLAEHGRKWHVYHDGMAQLIAFRRLWADDRIRNWYCFEEFARHVADNQLPSYSFIEPCHSGPRSNNQHPGNNDADSAPAGHGTLTDFQRGEELIISIYETLRANRAVFDRTVLVITYDEHGGLYDHVPPPRALSPQPLGNSPPRSLWVRIVSVFREQSASRFRFHRYGPRVPAIVVSPRVAATVDATRYDHTSIPATLRALFAPGARPLSQREHRANTFGHLVTDTVRDDLPDLSQCRPQPVPAAPGVRAGTAAPTRRDEFAVQLGTLAAHLDTHLPPEPTTPVARVIAGRRLAAADSSPARTDRVAARFVARAAARRQTHPGGSS